MQRQPALLAAALPLAAQAQPITGLCTGAGAGVGYQWTNVSATNGENLAAGMAGVFACQAILSPAPAPARSYLVFLDWDRATLTSRAQQIVKQPADNSTNTKYTPIEVSGYTDTSGTPQYNQGLSIRRAQAVAAELVKHGVPRDGLAIQGFDETHLLVATG